MTDLRPIEQRFRVLVHNQDTVTEQMALVYVGQALIDVPRLLAEVRALREQMDVWVVCGRVGPPTWREIGRVVWRKLHRNGRRIDAAE